MAKTTVLGIRLTEDERADLEKAATEASMGLAAWAKASLLRDSSIVPTAKEKLASTESGVARKTGSRAAGAATAPPPAHNRPAASTSQKTTNVAPASRRVGRASKKDAFLAGKTEPKKEKK